MFTRQSRGGGTSSGAAYEIASTNNTTELHFAKRSMGRFAPDALQPIIERVHWAYHLGLSTPATTASQPIEYRHVATNNGSVTSANGTFWFLVTDITPMDGLNCPFSVRMAVIPAGSPFSRTLTTFCSSTGLQTSAAPLMPGLYRLELTASIRAPIKISRGELLVFTPITGGLTLDDRPTIFFLFGSRTHDSVIHFDGWENAKPKSASL